MAQHEIFGVPTFSGDVFKVKLDPAVAPSFDEAFPVKIRKVQLIAVPCLKNDEVRVTKVQSGKSTFNEQADVRIYNVMR